MDVNRKGGGSGKCGALIELLWSVALSPTSVQGYWNGALPQAPPRGLVANPLRIPKASGGEPPAPPGRNSHHHGRAPVDGASNSRPDKVDEPADLSLPLSFQYKPVVSETEPAGEKRIINQRILVLTIKSACPVIRACRVRISAIERCSVLSRLVCLPRQVDCLRRSPRCSSRSRRVSRSGVGCGVEPLAARGGLRPHCTVMRGSQRACSLGVKTRPHGGAQGNARKQRIWERHLSEPTDLIQRLLLNPLHDISIQN
jgi:hypothetical protein